MEPTFKCMLYFRPSHLWIVCNIIICVTRVLPVTTGSDFLTVDFEGYGILWSQLLSVCSILDHPICGLFVTLMVKDIQFYFGTRTKL